MVELTIDGIKAKAEKHETILDVAKRLEIKIPTLCYHAKLGPFGGCRLCMVEIDPGNCLVASCITKVFNNMVVKTQSPMAVHARKVNLELILARHPADCLVCEKGGKCELQEASFTIGVSGDSLGIQNRIAKIFDIQPSDPNMNDDRAIIECDMNKCVFCKRCIRICHDIQGVGAISFFNRSYTMGIGAFYGRTLDCEFCGQCVDICPVGALVYKAAKYRARPWEMEKVKTTCTYCGCGCTMFLNVKGNNLVKVTGSDNVGINQGNLCARGRYGSDFVSHEKRLRSPMIKKSDDSLNEVSWDYALDYAASRLMEIKNLSGAKSIAALGSPRCTNEENYLLQKIMRVAIGTPHLDSSTRLEQTPATSVLADSFGYPAATNSIQDILSASAIMVINANVTEAHPIVGINIKQAVRKHGAHLILIEPKKTKLETFSEISLRPKLNTEVALLNGIAHIIVRDKLENEDFIAKQTEGFDGFISEVKKYTPEYVEQVTGISVEQLEAAAHLYGKSRPASIIFGSDLTQSFQGGEAVKSLVNLAQLCGNLGVAGGGVIPLRVQNNAQGSCDMGMLPDYLPGYQPVGDAHARERLEKLWGGEIPSEPGLGLEGILEAIEVGEIKALYLMGENPLLNFSQKERILSALKKLELLILHDIFSTEIVQLADVVLPGVSFAEREGTFTNTERRVQLVRCAIYPLEGCKPDWQILIDLSARLGYEMTYRSPAQIMKEIAEAVPVYGGIDYTRLDKDGLQWPCLDKNHPGSPVLYSHGFGGRKAMFRAVRYREVIDENETERLSLVAGMDSLGTMSHHSKTLQELSKERS